MSETEIQRALARLGEETMIEHIRLRSVVPSIITITRMVTLKTEIDLGVKLE